MVDISNITDALSLPANLFHIYDRICKTFWGVAGWMAHSTTTRKVSSLGGARLRSRSRPLTRPLTSVLRWEGSSIS